MNVSGAGRHGWAPTNCANLHGGDGGVCACVCSRFHVRACGACVPMRANECVRDVFAIYDNNI